jgi:hypothetical protein
MTRYEFKSPGEIFEWRGPAPFHFLRVDRKLSTIIKERAKGMSYGWGVIHIHGELNKVKFETAMIPKDGAYLIPIKDVVRRACDLEIGDEITVRFNLGKSPSSAKN